MIALEKLTVRFGGIVALDAVSARFCAPVAGVVGPNGAGKTTTMNVISGFLSCSGAVTVDGTDLMQMPPSADAGACAVSSASRLPMI